MFTILLSCREILNGIAVTDENGNKLGDSRVSNSDAGTRNEPHNHQ